MRRQIISLLCALTAAVPGAMACTNFIITKGASTDGSVMVSYSADSHQLYGSLDIYRAPRRVRKGATVDVIEWDTGRFLTRIHQVGRTYSTIGNMNERQVIIGETTFGGREELVDSLGQMDYGSMIHLALQRAATAREAIEVMVSMADTYGYCSEGETFSIADSNEAWIMEVIGKGTHKADGQGKGIVWVARRIPDGYICAHANQSRITTFPKDDPENCLYAPDVISFAREMGYFDGEDEEFSFCDAYCPLSFGAMRGCESRVWSFFNTFCQGMDRYLDFAMGYNPDNRMPLWIKPDSKISPKQVFDAMRDHYEGTPMDMTQDIGAAGAGTPYRWRPMEFEIDGHTYTNERATATQQTGFWFVGQARGFLPDPVGGIFWFGVDDAATSCLTPIYCGCAEVPWCLSGDNGSLLEYSDSSSFWIFNRVAQFAYLRYDTVGHRARQEADRWENAALEETLAMDSDLARMPRRKMIRQLTQYSVRKAQALFDTWRKLDSYLMVKYIDGNVKIEDSDGFVSNGFDRRIPVFPEQPGYDDIWKRAVARDRGEILMVPEQ